jgi:formylglycine-generating enzyme required for sulfatase activity
LDFEEIGRLPYKSKINIESFVSHPKSMRIYLFVLLSASTSLSWAFADCSVCPKMVTLKTGSFYMGSSDLGEPISSTNSDLRADENPQHLVNIQSFALGKFEVTQTEWNSLMGTDPSLKKGSMHPVENISWNDAQLYVKKLSQKTGKKYRLPSEAEWEYAARAGSTAKYPWGDAVNQIDEYTWSRNNATSTKAVGLKKPNQFGLHDMIGNIAEWTEDCWQSTYQNAPADGSAWLSGNCSLRVLRGGAWGDDPQNLRVTVRDGTHPTYYRFSSSGFRVARDLE